MFGFLDVCETKHFIENNNVCVVDMKDEISFLSVNGINFYLMHYLLFIPNSISISCVFQA